MLDLIDGLVALVGQGAAVGVILAAAAGVASIPLWTWHARGQWPRVEARVTAIAQRRTLASNTWAVGIAFTPEGTAPDTDTREIEATVQVNLVRRPLALGDHLTVMHHPAYPARTAMTRWQGAGTPLMLAPLIALAAAAAVRD
ncbi:MAG: DUF3592 domain-containing protein [Pseudomonadota bacterium]